MKKAGYLGLLFVGMLLALGVLLSLFELVLNLMTLESVLDAGTPLYTFGMLLGRIVVLVGLAFLALWKGIAGFRGSSGS